MKVSQSHKHAVIERGFTLIEILLVLVVIVLLAGAGWGIYRGTYERMLVKSAATKLVLAAKEARLTAIRQGCYCEIELSQDGKGFVVSARLPGEITEQMETTILRHGNVEFGGHVMVEKATIKPVYGRGVFEREGRGQIIFRPDGRVDAAMLQFGDGKNHYSVRICSGTGKAKLFRGTAEQIKVGVIDLDADL